MSTTRTTSERSVAAPAAITVPGTLAFLLALLMLTVAVGGCLVLALQRLAALSVPGCDLQGACARAAASVWGSLPVLGWPTSYVGLAYFAALLAAWIAGGGHLPRWTVWMVRLGAAASVALVVIMIVGGYLCPYCLAVHFANLVFTAVVEHTVRRGPDIDPATRRRLTLRPAASVAMLALTFVCTTAALAGIEAMQYREIVRLEQSEFEDSTRTMVDQAQRAERPVAPDAAPSPTGEVETPSTPESAVDDSAMTGGEGAPPSGSGFTGRYRLGPDPAPIRLVVISDYQCPDCRRIESEIQELLEERDDLSFSAKHFPFCIDCNVAARRANYNPHPNACWAARAAEAAGMLYGEDGFWRMHDWLFERGGAFTDAELDAGLEELGFERDAFIRRMTSDEALALVEADVAEGVELGLRQTPMIFVNGVQLRGWRTPGAVRTAVERLAEASPPARSARDDRPPSALEKHLGDWASQPRQSLPTDAPAVSFGPDEARVRLVAWGDYQEPYTRELDARLRAIVGASADVRYEFRHYPIDESCNPGATRTAHPMACIAARAVEAAARLGGADAARRLHEALFERQAELSLTVIVAVAGSQGLDPTALVAAMEDPETALAIREDAEAARRRGLRGVPFLFVNDRRVPFWRLEGEPLVERIVESARSSN